jgi:hypothetical protein
MIPSTAAEVNSHIHAFTSASLSMGGNMESMECILEGNFCTLNPRTDLKDYFSDD